MINLDHTIKENIKGHYLNWPKIYLYVSDPNDAKFEFLINKQGKQKLRKPGLKYFKD